MAYSWLAERFLEEGCFTIEEAIAATERPASTVRRQVAYLLEHGYAKSVRRGLYVLDPDRLPLTRTDRFVLATKITSPYLLGHHSALELLGVPHTAHFTTVTVSTPTRFHPFRYQGDTFRAVLIDPALIDLGSTQAIRSGRRIVVASRELALVQCADRPDLSGGFSEIVESVAGFPHLNWPRLMRILESIDKKALYRKVGWLVARNADRWEPPEEVVATLRRRLGTGTTYFGVRPRGRLRLDDEWQVVVPAGGGEATDDAW